MSSQFANSFFLSDDAKEDREYSQLNISQSTPKLNSPEPLRPEQRICTLKERHDEMTRVCESARAKRRYEKLHNRTGIRLGGVIINKAKRFLFCRLLKDGIMAARRYFGELNTARTVPIYKYQRGDYPGRLKDEGTPVSQRRPNLTSLDLTQEYVLIKDYPLKKIMPAYRQYTKALVVRHPLQRAVSAFYQMEVQGGHRHAKRNSQVSKFIKFLENRFINSTINSHWRTFQSACYPCDLRYRYVLKLENVNRHIPELNAALREPYNHSFPHHHVNEVNEKFSTFCEYKYDVVLRAVQRKRPDLMQALIDVYGLDMKMFGYTWNGRFSGCSTGSSGCC